MTLLPRHFSCIDFHVFLLCYIINSCINHNKTHYTRYGFYPVTLNNIVPVYLLFN